MPPYRADAMYMAPESARNRKLNRPLASVREESVGPADVALTRCSVTVSRASGSSPAAVSRTMRPLIESGVPVG
jgi:hypothetical protein